MKRDETWTLASLNFIGDFNLGAKDCFKLNKDLDGYDISFGDFITANSELNKILRKEPDEMFFHITFVAGHGMHFQKSQCILLNEFDKMNNFYKMLAIETSIR